MKVLFDHDSPFQLAHGGFQIQIEQTLIAVRAQGVDAEELRWWDEAQRPDLIHFFSRPSPGYTTLAQNKGIKIVFAPLLTGVGSRSPGKLFLQRALFGFMRNYLPKGLTVRLNWDPFLQADAIVALTPFEAGLMTSIYGADPAKVQVIPNGVEDAFLKSAPATRGKWLVSTAAITDRKRVVELALAAVAARTPVWVIGKPYAENEPYAQRFFKVAKEHPEFVRYEGGIHDRGRLAQVYREARGFVLLSDRESLSISALEAAACECPLLLSDLAWARTTMGANATYCPIAGTDVTARALRGFYDAAPGLPTPTKPKSWLEIGAEFKALYARVCNASR